MPSLKAVQKVVPSAEAMVGRVIAYHEGKHVDLGDYLGEDAVALNSLGDRLMAEAAVAAEAAKSAAAEEVKAKKAGKGKKSDPAPDPAADAEDAELARGLSASLGALE